MGGCSGGSCSSCSGEEPDGQERLPPGMLKQYDLNESTADGTLVWIETGRDGRLTECSEEILSAVSKMKDGRTIGIVFGGIGVKQLFPRIFGFKVDTLLHVRDPRLETYMPEAYAECIASACERFDPAVILMPSSPRGRELAPRVAAIIGCGLTADCTSIRIEDRRLTVTRPAFGGNVMADIGYNGFPQMATVRPGALERYEPKPGIGSAMNWQYDGDSIKTIQSEEPCDGSVPGIDDARVIISLGNGVRRKASIEAAERIAEAVGAEVCCSRALVEKGWMPRSRQVGLSGRTVTPELYIAFGISGSAQHRAGMQNSGRIVAVNKDPDAPIHAISDLSLVADADDAIAEWDRKVAKLKPAKLQK